MIPSVQTFWLRLIASIMLSSGLLIFNECRFLISSAVDFGYDGQNMLFRNLDFGIDMNSRGTRLTFYFTS